MVSLQKTETGAHTLQAGQGNSLTEPADHRTGRYGAYLTAMEKNGWRPEKAVIRETDAEFIRVHPLRRGCTGTVLELCCPQSKAISVFGKNQDSQGLKTEIPYLFTVRCYDGDNRELDPGCRINIKKVSVHGGISPASRAAYGDIKPAGYQFPEGMYLWHGEILTLEVLNPDIDIECVKLSMEADIFQAFI